MIPLPTRTDLYVALEFPSGMVWATVIARAAQFWQVHLARDAAVAVTTERRRGNVESGAGARLALQSTR